MLSTVLALGSERARGVSGGEKRRVMIAQELVGR
jgi:ABC-type multidrug transport system ATPase subunit